MISSRRLHWDVSTSSMILPQGRPGHLIRQVPQYKCRASRRDRWGLALQLCRSHRNKPMDFAPMKANQCHTTSDAYPQGAVHAHVHSTGTGRCTTRAPPNRAKAVLPQRSIVLFPYRTHRSIPCMWASSTGLVGAKDVGAGHLLHGAHARDDGALLRERARAQGKGHRQHRGHRDGDAAHDDDQHVEQRGATVCAAQAMAQTRSSAPCQSDCMQASMLVTRSGMLSSMGQPSAARRSAQKPRSTRCQGQDEH